MIKREHYLKQIRGFYHSDLIKVITGIRRCGKSVILSEIKEEISKETDNIIDLNFEDYLTLERTNISTRKANQIAAMFEYYLDGFGQNKIVGTAWGAYNAVTGYQSNIVNMSGEKRMDSLLYGGANNTMQRAFVQALELAEAV